MPFQVLTDDTAAFSPKEELNNTVAPAIAVPFLVAKETVVPSDETPVGETLPLEESKTTAAAKAMEIALASIANIRATIRSSSKEESSDELLKEEMSDSLADLPDDVWMPESLQKSMQKTLENISERGAVRGVSSHTNGASVYEDPAQDARTVEDMKKWNAQGIRMSIWTPDNYKPGWSLKEKAAKVSKAATVLPQKEEVPLKKSSPLDTRVLNIAAPVPSTDILSYVEGKDPKKELILKIAPIVRQIRDAGVTLSVDVVDEPGCFVRVSAPHFVVDLFQEMLHGQGSGESV